MFNFLFIITSNYANLFWFSFTFKNAKKYWQKPLNRPYALLHFRCSVCIIYYIIAISLILITPSLCWPWFAAGSSAAILVVRLIRLDMIFQVDIAVEYAIFCNIVLRPIYTFTDIQYMILHDSIDSISIYVSPTIALGPNATNHSSLGYIQSLKSS